MNQLHSSTTKTRETHSTKMALFILLCSIKKRWWIFDERTFMSPLSVCVCARSAGVAIINFDKIYKLYQKPFLQGNQTRDEIRSNLWICWSERSASAYTHELISEWGAWMGGGRKWKVKSKRMKKTIKSNKIKMLAFCWAHFGDQN